MTNRIIFEGENSYLSKVYKKMGEFIVSEMKEDISEKGKVASGKLIRSIKYKVNNRKKILIIKYAKHGEFVDKGRDPGTMPPKRAIKKWMRLKGIPPQYLEPIRLKIFNVGYKGIHFSDNFHKVIKSYKKIIESNMALDVNETIESIINDLQL